MLILYFHHVALNPGENRGRRSSQLSVRFFRSVSSTLQLYGVHSLSIFGVFFVKEFLSRDGFLKVI